MTQVRVTTLRAIHDALALRGLDASGGGFVRTAAPELYMDAERLRLAHEVLRVLPASATTDNAPALVDAITPFVTAATAEQADTLPPSPRLVS